jgi:hypothetical protein
MLTVLLQAGAWVCMQTRAGGSLKARMHAYHETHLQAQAGGAGRATCRHQHLIHLDRLLRSVTRLGAEPQRAVLEPFNAGRLCAGMQRRALRKVAADHLATVFVQPCAS